MGYLPQRKQLRLNDYDYSQAGYYFVTICSENRENIFGQIVGADSISARPKMKLNNAGIMVENIYRNLLNEFKNINLYEYIIMPNHIHGIIKINETRADIESAPTTLPVIIQSLKRQTTIEYIEGVNNNIFSPFNKRIWQRSYYEHIIRTRDELLKVSEYIINNPVKWKDDKYYN